MLIILLNIIHSSSDVLFSVHKSAYTLSTILLGPNNVITFENNVHCLFSVLCCYQLLEVSGGGWPSSAGVQATALYTAEKYPNTQCSHLDI